MDEARKVIRRLERIEALQGAKAPAEELLSEVRQLLGEGEAWLAAERAGAGDQGDAPADGGRGATDPAAAALESCRATLSARTEVMLGATEPAPL